jgi:Flp pilus assembly protein TadB
MRFQDRIYLNVAKLLPPSYRDHIKKQLAYAGVKDQDEDILLGANTLLAVLIPVISLLVPLAFGIIVQWWYLAIGVGVAVMVEVIFYMLIFFKATDRAKRAEEALPDFLHLVSSNLRAGMTPYNALKSSRRKEFGPLSDEIAHATQRAFGSESFSDILLKISKRLNSGTLERTLRLFTTSLRSGGHSAKLLEDLAKDITESRQLKNDFVSATKTYSMFISFTVAVGAPFLLTIAMQFVKMITGIAGKASFSGSSALGGLSMFAGQMPVSVDFLFALSISMLVGTGTLASVLMGVIKEGKLLEGLRFAPIMIAASIVVFFVAQRIIGGMF